MRLKTIFTALIDLSVVWLLMVLFDRILLHWWFIHSWILFTVLFYAYNVACMLWSGQTVGKAIIGCVILQNNEKKLRISDTMIREMIKTLLVVCMPISIFLFSSLYHHGLGFPVKILLGYFVIFMIFFCIDKMPWDWICKTKRNKITTTKYGMLKLAVAYVLLGLTTYLTLLIYNNKGNSGTSSYLGLKFPFRLLEYPDNKNIAAYKDWLAQPLPDAKDYVLSLFDRYDIVVLEEGTHDAIPQWDLIYDIVSDNRFIEKAGTVFTEYGSSLLQEDLNTVLQTNYDDSILLTKDLVASVNMRPMGYCFLNYLVKLNRLNSTLPDSLKIWNRGLCPEDGKYLSLVNYQDSAILHGTYYMHYDSCMAQAVIDWYAQTHCKCLVITNTIHAFAMQKEKQASLLYLNHLDKRQTQRIYDQYPVKTANVMFYHLPHFLPLIHNGKWGAAFKANQYKNAGFDLRATPFGGDDFDYHNFHKYEQGLKYQDVFHGIVFYAPENTFIFQDTVPYLKYAVEQEYLRYVKKGKADSNSLFTLQLFQQTQGNTSPTMTAKEILAIYDKPLSEQSFLHKIITSKVATLVTIGIWNFIDVLFAIVLVILSAFTILSKCLISVIKKAESH
ncbi:MAG: RDD family protein [Bacteroidales bacterium]|nr:RDD family protein [Bacteroidales bacterium]